MKQRKRNRMQGFDYSTDAIYFITMCCKHMICHFGEILNHEMVLNKEGKIAHQQIEWLQQHYPYCLLHNFVVMPNHIHILFEINRNGIVGSGRDLTVPEYGIKIKPVPELMGAYQTTSSKQIHLSGNMDFKWHRSFHDVIVRSKKRFDIIDNYISENPERWDNDKYNR